MRFVVPKFNSDLLSGAVLGAVAATALSFLPYRAIVAALPEAIGVSEVVALGLAVAAVAVHVRRPSPMLVARPEASDESPSLAEPAMAPGQWLKRDGFHTLDAAVDVEARLKEALSSGLRSIDGTTVTGWRLLLLRCIAAHGCNETVAGVSPLDVLADMGREIVGGGDGQVLDGMAASYLAGVQETRSTAALSAAAGRHGTLESLFLGVLATARSEGALPSAAFTWLKVVDRPLWYALNNLGRETFHVEGLAAIAHYEAEVASGGMWFYPSVGDAVCRMLPLAERLAGTGIEL